MRQCVHFVDGSYNPCYCSVVALFASRLTLEALLQYIVVIYRMYDVTAVIVEQIGVHK